MASINKVFLIGNLGQDPESRDTPSAFVCNFNIATSEVWNDKSTGERRERTEWHKIVVWGEQAQHCAQYLKKGRSCHIEGRIQTRDYEDKEGIKRYVTEIKADRVTFLGPKDAALTDTPRSSPGRIAPVQSSLLSDDDIPF